MTEQLRKALKLSEYAKIVRHPSGDVNHVYRVQDSAAKVPYCSTQVDMDVAVKWLGEDNFSGINRTHQFVLQQQLYKLNIAPEPLWLSDDERFWVEQWQPNTQSCQRNPETLANVLARIHQLPVTARPLNLTGRWQHYMEVGQLAPDDALYLKAMNLRSSVLKSEQDDEDLVLCHNDLLSSHVLCRQGDMPVVIDWEYAAMGNRYFDIASCCMINKLEPSTCHQLLACYAKLLSIPLDIAQEKLAQHKEIVSLTNALWFEALNVSSAEANFASV
ncbi:MAG: choline kinase [Alteromonas sp. Nap_26]|nr:MAG: choline kinase [Alteromonas sp. Nap_26]